MKLSYRLTVLLFFFLAILPIALFWYFVQVRLEQGQLTLQLFLQNQVDVDRKILAKRATLRSVQPALRSFLLNGGTDGDRKRVVAESKKTQDEQEKFWKKYEADYAALQRPFLLGILKETQELNLAEEEAKTISDIQRKMNEYFSVIDEHLNLPGLSGSSFLEHIKFLEELDRKREVVYDSINELADIRYIFSQRIVFMVSGENERQNGFFSLVFAVIAFAAIIISILEYFFIHKPVSDIMAFLRDLAGGKRGQRLYFSSPIREIKESEEIINEFVSEAEEHQKE